MSRRCTLARGITAAALFASAAVGAAAQSSVTALPTGTPLERSLPAGETHRFRLTLGIGDCLCGSALAQTGTTTLRIVPPAGTAASEATPREVLLNYQGGPPQPDTVTYVAPVAGEYHVELEAAAKGAADRYTLTVGPPRPASANERTRHAAETAFWSGYHEASERSPESLSRAVPRLADAVRLAHDLNDPALEGSALNELGGAHRLLGQNTDALDAFAKAVPLLRQAGITRLLAATLNNMGAIQYARGESRRAFTYFGQAVEVARTSGDRQAEGILVNNMGAQYLALGDYQSALDRFLHSLDVRRAVKDTAGEVRTLNNMALSYRMLGDLARSKQTALDALALADRAGSSELQSVSLNNLGMVERQLGELTDARGHLVRALEIFRARNELRLMGATLNNLGDIHLTQGRTDLARQAFEEGLAVGQRGEERLRQADSHRNLGRLALATQRPTEAIARLTEALSIEREIAFVEGQAETERLLAQAFLATGQPVEARQHSDAALRIVESQRSKVGSAQLRALYFSAKREFYDLHVDLLLRDSRSAAVASAPAGTSATNDDLVRTALETSERARARSLVDLLREAGVAVREGVDPALLEREDALKQRIDVLESTRVRAMSERPNPQRIASIERDIAALFAEYEQVQGAIRTNSPRYAALRQGETIRASDIQQALDDETVVLEYLLGEERSYLWIVGRSAVAAATLPPRADIERLAREVYSGLTANAAGRRSGVSKLAEARAALSRMLLGPAVAQLGARRVVVVADGALLYVPFGLLDTPSPNRVPRPLLADHEVVHLPSMSSLLVMRSAPRQSTAMAGSVAIVADPVFSIDDARVRRPARSTGGTASSTASLTQASTTTPSAGTRSLERAVEDSGVVRFSRLRFTRDEADRIAALVPAGRRAVHTDFAASREVATSEAFGRHQVLHFATHGLINGIHPDLSGLVFSLVDAQGQARDGFLRLHDIYNLKLQADLVVLSACQTALGQDVRGEGLIGLTRGFMYAGASRIVASLWDVDDRATAVLMERFYLELLQRKQRPAEALRRAQQALMSDPRWSHPYYWGAFVILGDWE